MGYFWSPPLFILKVFINCLIVLQLLTIWLYISHYVVLASILINYDFYALFLQMTILSLSLVQISGI